MLTATLEKNEKKRTAVRSWKPASSYSVKELEVIGADFFNAGSKAKSFIMNHVAPEFVSKFTSKGVLPSGTNKHDAEQFVDTAVWRYLEAEKQKKRNSKQTSSKAPHEEVQSDEDGQDAEEDQVPEHGADDDAAAAAAAADDDTGDKQSGSPAVKSQLQPEDPEKPHSSWSYKEKVSFRLCGAIAPLFGFEPLKSMSGEVSAIDIKGDQSIEISKSMCSHLFNSPFNYLINILLVQRLQIRVARPCANKNKR